MKLTTLQAELPNFKIKLLTATDQAELLALEQSNPEYRRSLGAGEITLAEIQQDLVAHPDTVMAEQKQVFGFYLAGHLVAVVDLINQYPKADFMFIGLLMVGASYQRHSVGTVIMTGLMQAALKSDIKCLQLTRVSSDAGVEAFLTKLGFEDGDQLYLPMTPTGRLAVTTMTRVLV